MAQTQKDPVIAVAGATGAVGAVLPKLLEERNFPVSQLKPLASERSAGTQVRFRGQNIPVEVAQADAFDGVDFAFFAATGSLSKELAPEVAKRGGVALDKSSTWRMNDDVPLVVPELNPDALDHPQGIVAWPNCTTIGFVMALEPLRRIAGLKSVVVTTLQAVSGAGLPGLEDLDEQLEATAADRVAPQPKAFAAPIAHNVVPLCENFRDDGFSSEEVKLLFETRKILEEPELDVSMTCVRVPVRVGHGASMLIETEKPLSPEQARAALSAFPGVEVIDDPEARRFPTPLDVEGRDEVLVGRVRRDLASDRLWLWQVSDNLRKGASTNAIQIAEELLRRR